DVEFVRTGYGKNSVKVLHIRREGTHHYIKEIKADVQLTLKTRKDYLNGDNGDIIPTDTIKNTVHALAKLKGDGAQHAHAFIFSPEAWRFCDVEQYRNENPVIHSGVKDMKVLKTTQSGFEGFLKDQFTTLQDARDRFFCTTVHARWRYNKDRNMSFDTTWKTVKDTIIEKFAGPFDRGEYSQSVQKTLYDTQLLVFSRVPEVEEIEIIMPNQHYFTIDMTKMGINNKDEVYLPLDNPSGNITGT
ncbi:uricase-like, partial [Scleropages formosus]